MKKIIAGVALWAVMAVAMALPRPSQIEDAMAAGDIQTAKSMTQEVLREKPESAKAHLFNAYILVKEGNKGAAAEELKTAQRLDKKGDVKGSALFGRTAAMLEAPSAAPVKAKKAPVQTYSEPKESSSGFWVFLLIVVAGGGLVYYMFVYKKKEHPKAMYVPSYSGTAVKKEPAKNVFEVPAERIVRTREAYERPVRSEPVRRTYSAPAPEYYEPPRRHRSSEGMGMAATAASVAGGVVAGNMISDFISSHSKSESAPAREESRSSSDYETTRSSYSSGSDDSYSSPSSSSYSSDSWGSSDSGSSSSSDW